MLSLQIPELSLEAAKRAVIVRALREVNGNAEETAELLDVTKVTVYNWIRDYEITEDERYRRG